MSIEKKIWTFAEMLTKVREDTDLNEDDPDEQFVTKKEMIGYFNEAILEAESEIMTLNQDYFLAQYTMPLSLGTSTYDLPPYVFGRKIRSMVYSNGGVIYKIKRIKPYQKFETVAFSNEYAGSDDYRYWIDNPSPGDERINLIPAARETATVLPLTPVFTPVIIYYIRNANRVPYEGDYTNAEDILSSAVNANTNIITVNPTVTYVTGDAVKLSVTGSNTVPGGLSAGTVYYVIAVSSTTIKLATSAANATAGTAIDITSTGSSFFTLRVAATDTIIDATVIDIPEFSTFIMEWVKVKCMFKDGDPRVSISQALLEAQRKIMIDTLTESEPDDDNEICPDYSYYTDMS